MNKELKALFVADRQEHSNVPQQGTPAYIALRERDRQRRAQTAAITEAGGVISVEDYYHAAKLFQHGDTTLDAWNAHILALTAAERGYRPARWLCAAALDRSLMYRGKPQKCGTQYVWAGYRDRLWDVEPATTDDERAEWMSRRWQSKSGRRLKPRGIARLHLLATMHRHGSRMHSNVGACDDLW